MAINPSTMARLRCRTRAISTDPGPVTVPNSAARLTRSATLALQISFLLGRQLMFGHEPPIHRRSTTAVGLACGPDRVTADTQSPWVPTYTGTRFAHVGSSGLPQVLLERIAARLGIGPGLGNA